MTLLFGLTPAFSQIDSTVDRSQLTSDFSQPETPQLDAITFYSHSWGENFPHAFVILEATNEYGQTRSEAFGFTAKSLSPKILFGSVKGHVISPNARYIRQSDPHFTVSLTPSQRDAVYTVREKWSAGPASRYRLNRHNCVHFVGEIAQAAGLTINEDSEYFKKPAAFLNEVMALNPSVQRFAPVPEPEEWTRPTTADYESR
jgi:hypothetical protein